MKIGVTADPSRGGRPIGMMEAQSLTTDMFTLAVEKWPTERRFVVTVNSFEEDRVRRLLQSWLNAQSSVPLGEEVAWSIEVANLPQSAWSIEPRG